MIESVAVVGSGLMGRGIAYAAALGGFRGLDTRLAVLEFLHRSLGERYRPAPLFVQHVKGRRLGKRVGCGVYEYDGR